MNARVTRQRVAVLAVLADRQDFVSARQLHALLAAEGIRLGLSTVYRVLRDLEASDGVDITQVRSGERLFRMCLAGRHRHYLICRSCCRSRPVDAREVERWAGKVAAGSGFASVEHAVELTGVCGECQSAAEGEEVG